ncbi:MAG: M23 family metallopeptidase [Oscillospiraceae bacterium]|nr:M23 family metallopeptidase [Oscillospiraceae bacterium]
MENVKANRKKTPESEKMTPKELKRAVKLAICLVLFGAAAFVKTVFPGAVDKTRDDALGLIGGNVDYRAAIAVLGETVSGEKDLKEGMAEAYRYAFRTETGGDTLEAGAEAEEQEPDAEPEPPAEPEPEGEAVIQEYTPPERGLTATALTYSRVDETPPPEDASYNPAELCFTYAAPVSGAVTSHFGYRNHPVDKVVRFHYGTDIGAAEGADICAFADGTVYAVGEGASLGKYIMVDHPDGVRTVYGHCSEITVKDGDTVKTGQKIGEVGSTGNATGNCLHFEIRVNGIRIDPEYYLA